MRAVFLVLTVVLVARGDQEQDKVQRCNEVTNSYNTCSKGAYGRYNAALAAGTDGRPNFEARKACNYVTDGVETCGNLLMGECNEEAVVEAMKKKQLSEILKSIMATVENFDTVMCPAFQRKDSSTDGPEGGVSGLMVTPALVAVLLLL